MNEDHYTIVQNDRGALSIWPLHRGSLPAGWRSLDRQGTKSECLSKIEELAEQISPPSVEAPTPQESSTLLDFPASPELEKLTCSVPFRSAHRERILYCFPHAGSGASYYHFLARALRESPVEVQILQYPGRELRMKEAPIGEMPEMVATLLAGLSGGMQEGIPFSFFGHSMGALIAYELSHALVQRGAKLPETLFLSGRQAPHIPVQELPVDTLSDADFLDAVGRRYNAIPQQILDHPELLELILPSLRADFGLMQRYRFQTRPPLPIPLVLINGTRDPWVEEQALDAWSQHSTLPIQKHRLEGDHFYLQPNAHELQHHILSNGQS